MIAYAPDPQQLTTTALKRLGEIDDLKTVEHPGKAVNVARAMHYRDDSVFISVLLQGIQQLALDPDRRDGSRRQYNHEPITPLKSGSNFVVPLLSTEYVGATVPDRNAVSP